jgi:multiple sugar transport system ATP-binding protein
MTMADKIVVMHDGIVEQSGPPLELYDRPANLFVASFIGSPAMNQIEGTISAGDGAPSFITADGTRLPLPARLPAGAAGKAAVYGIRPEHFSVSDTGIPIKVVVIEPTGSETQVIARLGGQEITGLFRERITLQPGDTIHLAPDIDKVHLFDKQTGARL